MLLMLLPALFNTVVSVPDIAGMLADFKKPACLSKSDVSDDEDEVVAPQAAVTRRLPPPCQKPRPAAARPPPRRHRTRWS